MRGVRSLHRLDLGPQAGRPQALCFHLGHGFLGREVEAGTLLGGKLEVGKLERQGGATANARRAQILDVAARLVELGKRRGIAMFLIGHVTKDGALAGPKVLEHLVDTVLSFEGDASLGFRMVRATEPRIRPALDTSQAKCAEGRTVV